MSSVCSQPRSGAEWRIPKLTALRPPFGGLRALLRTAVVSLLCAPSLYAVEPLSFPAAGIVDLDECTIEMWVRLEFDPQEHHEGQVYHGFAYEVNYGDPTFPQSCLHWHVFSQYVAREQEMWTRMYNQAFDPINGQRLMYSLLATFPKDAQLHSWHHVAAAFRGRRRWLYVNGQGGATELNGRFAHMLRQAAVLRFGTDWRKLSPQLAFDEIRVSSVVRSPDELGFHATEPLKPDRYTTLLVNFDNGTEGGCQPVWAATPAASAPQPLPAGTALIEGKFGRALTFVPPQSGDADKGR